MEARQAAPRPYRQVARAAATDRLQQRIVEVFFDFMLTTYLDDITLDAVAAAAGTTRQTVIRMFGGKEKLVAVAWHSAKTRILSTRVVPPKATTAQIAQALVKDYESTGDMLVRFLSQEDRYPDIGAMLNVGRNGHRTWIAETFADHLDGLSDALRERRIDQLVAVTDLYVWKLFRRDFGRDADDVADLIAGLVDKVLAERRP
ncbi:TetR/AcrR family transcriptional regulator [Methylobacterium sp. J-070]|uniref:TetR/AcrR family transcriptional regulator n=1 Tax=Methylobacterium sp. J-070 TaxID=2836650 RepID=UPI001FB8F3E2|nr:TetR family transcriptional regulator [Methylobacterium sp. J-070]MCJ2053794.1 TetR family transcriptional regulator [Methylobacterium sp. J-070]